MTPVSSVFQRNSKQMEGGATFWSGFLESRAPGASVLVDAANSISLSDIILYAQMNRPTEAQSNGALRELQAFLLVTQPSLNVSESTNAAAAILGRPAEFSRLRVDKVPELGLVSSVQTEGALVSQMAQELQTVTRFPPVPLETRDLRDAVDTVAAVLQNQPTVTLQPVASLASGPSSLREEMVNLQAAQDRQTLLWLLVISIPFLLQSFMSEARTLGILLLTFFFGVVSSNTKLVDDVRQGLMTLLQTVRQVRNQ